MWKYDARSLLSKLAEVRHWCPLFFLLSIALGLAGVVLRSASAVDALFLLLQATIIVVVVTILERRGRGV